MGNDEFLRERIDMNLSDLNIETGLNKEVTQSVIQSLIETLQELVARLAVLAAVKGVQESLRVQVVTSASLAVTGPTTLAQLSNENNRQNNLLATLANINNAVGA